MNTTPNLTATRTEKSIEIRLAGELVDTLAGKATIAKPFVAVSFGPVWTGYDHERSESTFEDQWVATAHATAALAEKANRSDVHRGNAGFRTAPVV